MINLRETWAGLQRDAALRAQIIQAVGWLAPVFWIALWLVARVLRDRGYLGPEGYWWLLRINVLLAIGLGLAAARLFRIAAEGVVQTATAGGSAPRQPTFSLEESMIARGAFQDARETLESRLDQGADDLAVQLRLAELHTRHLHDHSGAERWYLAARRTGGDAGQRIMIANGLIDVYRSSGQSGRLMVELARFAEAWPDTRAAKDARRELQELKRELT